MIAAPKSPALPAHAAPAECLARPERLTLSDLGTHGPVLPRGLPFVGWQPRRLRVPPPGTTLTMYRPQRMGIDRSNERRSRSRFAPYLSQHHTHVQQVAGCIHVDIGKSDAPRSWNPGES